MMRHALIAPLVLAAVGLVALAGGPAAAQTANSRVLTIYGDDKCPTSSDGSEIVVCQRKPESERYRIPDELRRTENTPGRQGWGERGAAVDAASAQGTGTAACSTVGPAGASGCFGQIARKAKAERKQKAQEEADRTAP